MNSHIQIVAIYDDSPDSRESISEELSDANYVPKSFDGPFEHLEEMIQSCIGVAEAVICDHQLMQRRYATFLGAEAVAGWYKSSIPSVLVSRYGKHDYFQILPHRRFIPCLLSPEEASQEAYERGWLQCIDEFGGNFSASRKPWHTLLRIEGVDQTIKPPLVYAVIPSWDPKEGVKLPLTVIPTDLQKNVVEGARFFAKVNIGAENGSDLYFFDFEFRKK